MSEFYTDYIPLDLGATVATETITIDVFGYVIEDGVERHRKTGTRQLEGYHIQNNIGGVLLTPGGLRSDMKPTLHGPDTDLIQSGTQIVRDRTGETFRVNHVAHEIQWLAAELDQVAT